MTTLREAAQQALEAMTSFESGTNGLYQGEFSAEIAALRAALAEPVQEPVAWLRVIDGKHTSNDGGNFGKEWAPLYTAPRKSLAEWQMVLAWGGGR